MEPELAEDGCNWHNYGSWVLKALLEDDLMGYLDGSETRPTNPSLLQGGGDDWTPQTDEEREAVMVWRTNDSMWQQRAAMAHYVIISGIPDSILMLVMHLETPHETFAYLENRYGSIPRPESLKFVDKTARQHDLPSKQYVTEESALGTCDSVNKPLDTPSMEEDPSDFPNDCAEITDGHEEPKAEIVDARLVENHLLVVEVGTVDAEWSNERTNALDAPDEGSQCASNKVAESRDLPEPSSKALDPVDSTVGQASGRPIKCIPQTCLKYNQCTETNSETILDIPDPPDTQSEHPILGSHTPTRTHSATSTEFFLPVLETAPKEPDKVEGDSRHDDAPSNRYIDSCEVEELLLADGESQYTECEAKRPKCSPAPPTPLPKHTGHVSRPYRVLRRRGRIRTHTESVSSTRMRQNAYRVQAALMRPPLSLFTPTKRSIYPAGGSWMVKVHYNKVRSARRGETRGYTHHDSHTNVSPPREVLQHLRNISNTFWLKGVPPGSRQNDAKQPTNLPMAKRLPVSSSMRRDNKHRAERQNGLPAPWKPARRDFVHPHGTLRDPRRRGRIKTKAKNVSRSEMRGSKASGLTIATSPPREIAKPLWNVANTYWRHGVPPGRTCNVNKPLLFETVVLRQQYRARGRAAQQTCSRNGSCHNAQHSHSHDAAPHTKWTRSCPWSSYTCFYSNIWYTFSFKFFILHPYLIIQWSLRGCVGACKSPLYCRS
ncbi:hypothetical protein EDC04DRAFT_382131 [Pisolithus marmoratus]|nr:hypothetical protein EDC04DRAFT_382131 [Pisolithus marmoratus]